MTSKTLILVYNTDESNTAALNVFMLLQTIIIMLLSNDCMFIVTRSFYDEPDNESFGLNCRRFCILICYGYLLTYSYPLSYNRCKVQTWDHFCEATFP